MDYKDCDKAVAASGGKVLGITIPDNMLYYGSPGMNLDNTWQADIGVQVRQINLTGSVAFEIAHKLAIKDSVHLLETIGNFIADDMNHSVFWGNVQTTVSSESKLNKYEKFNHFPFQFITAGPYPDVLIGDSGYYLRINLKTSNDFLSGTNADIKLVVSGKEFALDYMRGANFLVAYSDFEAGDDTVHTVGPFTSLPENIALKNDAPSVGNIIVQVGRDIVNGFISLGESIKDIFTNDMDYVGTNGFLLDPSWLSSIAVGASKSDYVYINGKEEGQYKVHFDVEKVSDSNGGAEATYSIMLTELYCKKESDHDGFYTLADEPILMAVLASYGLYSSKRQSFMERYTKVDSGETRYPKHTFAPVTLPRHGSMVLQFRIWESDSESGSDRRQALNEFLGEKKKSIEETFLDKIAEATTADWKVESIRVYAP